MEQHWSMWFFAYGQCSRLGKGMVMSIWKMAKQSHTALLFQILVVWSYFWHVEPCWHVETFCMLGLRPLLCTYIGLIGPWKPPEDGEMSEMTLPLRHKIRNSRVGSLRPCTPPLGHGGSPQYWVSRVEKKHFCFFQTAVTGKRTPNSSVKGRGAYHYPRAPVLLSINNW